MMNKKPNDPRVNFLSRADNQRPRGKKFFRVSRFALYLMSILIIAFLVFSYQVLFTDSSLTEMFDGKISIFKQLTSIAGEGDQLKGEPEDRINILLLGMGGAGHEGPYLTDTIIFASFQPSTKKLAMVSLPRDLLVEIPGYGWWKINNANSFGETKEAGKGGLLVKEVIQNTLKQPVHYYVRVDFSGFEQMIDTLGGVKINVERSFTDFQFPTDDFKLQVVSFDEGWQTMDGDTALNYVRSRHGNNGEGSDFARSRRQQKLISALKDRMLSYSFFLSPRKISKLTKELSSHLRTDFEPWEIIQFAKLLEKADTSNIETLVLDDSPDGLLYANKVNEAYVLQPKGDDFEVIQYLVKNIFNKQQAIEEQKAQTMTVEIRNGTTIAGLASKNSTELKAAGFRVLQIGNAPEQAYEETEIYLLSAKDTEQAVKDLEELYDTKVQKNNIPSWVRDNAAPDLDFFIVLGSDANEFEEEE